MGGTHVVAFANQKGGVGKTTSAVNIAACVAALGHRVLLIDMDPQGNATSGVGINKKDLKVSVYDMILGKCEPERAIARTDFRNLSVIPSNISLAGSEFELVGEDSREFMLKTQTDKIRESGDFDYIVIDCPPSLGILTINCLAASDSVVIPMQCEYYSLEGLSQLMITIRKIKQLYNKNLTITGILITMYNGRLNLSHQVLNEIKKYYADKLFNTAIVRNVTLSEAPSYGTPIYYHDKYSKGSLAYQEVAKELMERI
jgi:ATPases involved in chromosome partitioning